MHVKNMLILHYYTHDMDRGLHTKYKNPFYFLIQRFKCKLRQKFESIGRVIPLRICYCSTIIKQHTIHYNILITTVKEKTAESHQSPIRLSELRAVPEKILWEGRGKFL